MPILDRASILNADDRRFEIVKTPEWGGDVRIASMSAYDRDKYDREFMKVREGEVDASIRALLVSVCVVDEAGVLLFTPEDVIALGKKSCAPVMRLFDACLELNELKTDAVEEGKKNS